MELTDFSRLREVVSGIVGSIQEKARQRILELQSGTVEESADKIFENSIFTNSGMFELLGDGTLIRFFVHVPQGPSSWGNQDVAYSTMLKNSKYWHKYHLFKCSTVDEWHKNMRKSSRSDGLMIYLLKNQRNGSGEHDSEQRKKGRALKICKKCFSQLPWKEKISFDLSKIMKTGPFRKELEQISEFRFEDEIPNQYAADWNKISHQIKVLRKWTCDLCKTYFGKNDRTRSFLQVHHKDRRRYNNGHTNLDVLCLACHFKFHPENNRLEALALKLQEAMAQNPEEFVT